MFSPDKKAHELQNLKPNDWLNSKPLTLEQSKGKVILLDFWTYSCINCLRTLPSLTHLWNTYKDNSFIIISIHTPEFAFEQEFSNLKKFVEKNNLTYPIVNDPDRFNWENYGNKYWPRSTLINPQGKIILEHVGESGYDEIEAKLLQELKLLREIKSIKPTLKEESHYYSPEISPETYAGKKRNPNGLGSHQVCTKQGCEEYVDSPRHHLHTIYLQGSWKQHQEYLECLHQENSYFEYPYYAQEVNLVLEGKGLIEILINNQPLTPENAGKNIIFKNSRSFLNITTPALYNLVHTAENHKAEIKIIPFTGLRIYALTFG